MTDLPTDWRGRSGPHQIVVDLRPDRVAERLAISLMFEDSASDFISQARQYAGEMVHTHFWIRAWRGGRCRGPTLHADMEEIAGKTRIVFVVEPDARQFYPSLIGVPLLFGGSLSLAFYTGKPFPAVILPFAVTAMVVIQFVLARTESIKLQRFFLELFAEDRLRPVRD